MEPWGFLLIIVLAFIAIQIYGFLRRKYSHSRRINDYFCNAVTVYAWLGENDAKVAALAAAKVAAGNQRRSMIAYLNGMAMDLGSHVPGTQLISKFKELEQEIKDKDWSLADIRDEKARLQNQNPEYLKALEKADPDVFIRKHPEFFKSLR